MAGDATPKYNTFPDIRGTSHLSPASIVRYSQSPRMETYSGAAQYGSSMATTSFRSTSRHLGAVGQVEYGGYDRTNMSYSAQGSTGQSPTDIYTFSSLRNQSAVRGGNASRGFANSGSYATSIVGSQMFASRSLPSVPSSPVLAFVSHQKPVSGTTVGSGRRKAIDYTQSQVIGGNTYYYDDEEDEYVIPTITTFPDGTAITSENYPIIGQEYNDGAGNYYIWNGYYFIYTHNEPDLPLSDGIGFLLIMTALLCHIRRKKNASEKFKTLLIV